MGQNCEKFLTMCIDSVLDADGIIYIDGGSTDNSLSIAEEYGAEIINHPYDQSDKEMNGKQRNVYLKHLQKKYSGYWCLAIDADEVVADLSSLKKSLPLMRKQLLMAQSKDPKIAHVLCSVHMEHFIGDLGHVDSTVEKHYVLNRLFLVTEGLEYPLKEHPVLRPVDDRKGISVNNDSTTIWHLAYVPNLWSIKKRYDNHVKKSTIHSPEYLKQWKNSHVFGTYPRKRVDPLRIPSVILETFSIDKDELYFANRGLEVKHYIDAMDWIRRFNPSNILIWGCGRGPRIKAICDFDKEYNTVDHILGIELSQWAVDNSICKNHNIIQGDICSLENPNWLRDWKACLSVAYDLLEHIPYDKIDIAISNIVNNTDTKGVVLLSIPFLGDPNLEADPTHIIKESREWWVNKFLEKGLEQLDIPEHFQYRQQLLLFRKRLQ